MDRQKMLWLQQNHAEAILVCAECGHRQEVGDSVFENLIGKYYASCDECLDALSMELEHQTEDVK